MTKASNSARRRADNKQLFDEVFVIFKAGFHMIADDRGSQVADLRRSQRELFPYNRRRSQAIAELTVAYISDSGGVKMKRKLC